MYNQDMKAFSCIAAVALLGGTAQAQTVGPRVTVTPEINLPSLTSSRELETFRLRPEFEMPNGNENAVDRITTLRSGRFKGKFKPWAASVKVTLSF